MATRVNVHQLRTRLGLSQPQFAKRIGVTERTVRRWENSGVGPSRSAAESLARADDRPSGDRHSNSNNNNNNNGPTRRAPHLPAPNASTVAHLPGDEAGATRLAPLAAVLPSLTRGRS